ncbi:hypothetical protein IVB41_00605 [Bradyrhizobium sp. 44]|uniref:hypothetical protein n=1 Tax=Bradyrhizobium sp. 44 TaxID=2782675 RepID=UPI001FFB74E8|nr:hypothetical protein [Bradyrhizobium sp. 44]MCK1282433.1 hypothetical protein [Bradyrhizobium sp. 44]
MADIQAAEARTLMSPVRTVFLGAVGTLVCVLLAWFEVYGLAAVGVDVPPLWFVTLIAANLGLMAFVAFRSRRFARRWLVAGGMASFTVVAGVFLLLQSAALNLMREANISLPSPPSIAAGGHDPPAAPHLPSDLPRVPTATAPPSVDTAPIVKQAPARIDTKVARVDDRAQSLPEATPQIAPEPQQAPPMPRPGADVQASAQEGMPAPKNGRVATIDGTAEPPPRLGPRAAPIRERPPSMSPSMAPAPPIASATPGLAFPPVASAPPPAGSPAPPAPRPVPPGTRLSRMDGNFGNFVGRAAPPLDIDGNMRADVRPSGRMAPMGSRPAGEVAVDGQVTPSPTPSPTPVPNAGSPTPEPVNTSAYWNSWFVDGAGPAGNILIANNTYTYTLDVAAFNYTLLRRITQSAGAKVDPAFEEMIADPRNREIVLTIKPLVPEGSSLRLGDDRHSYTLKIDLEKIRHPDADAARKFADGSMSITEFSAKASAGSIQIALTAESQGCATVAFAIFRGLQPLDHLVQRVSIGETSTSAPVCDSADPAQADALSSGLNPLRKVSLGMEGSGADATAAAALHIFDFEAYSMAVFVDGRPGKTPVYGWQTASSVVDFLRTDRFQNMILKARRDSADKKPGSYLPAAKELAKILFSTKSGNSTEDDAKNAWAAFRAIVRESTRSPVVVVRVASDVISGQNRSIYVPLGILGAKGPDPVLDKPIIVVQPMAIERYPSRDKCIGDWMFAVPDGLENVPGAVMPPGFFPAKVPGTRISEMDKLRQYLAATTGSVPLLTLASASAVGFVVLAHQDEGAMWFAESTDHIISQDIEKKFPSGSVGIFAACSAASAKGRNIELLQRLNEQGFDTLIASPFTIDAGYGVVFASTFAEIMAEVASEKPPPTILDLFDKTIARTAQKFKDRADADYSELGLEYVLLGNPAIKLCVQP